MSLIIPTSLHGTGGAPATITVETVEGDLVDLAVSGETPDEWSTVRTLEPEEARALAAALTHFASEVER